MFVRNVCNVAEHADVRCIVEFCSIIRVLQ